MRRALRIIFIGLLVWVLIFGIDQRWVKRDTGPYELIVADHGFHTAMYVAVDRLAASDNPTARLLAERYADAEFLEIGWGDCEFYMVMGGFENFELPVGARAFFLPTPSVMQLVPFDRDVVDYFDDDDVIILGLTTADYEALIDAALRGLADPNPIAPSRYGHGHFYEGAGKYTMFQTCNHWMAKTLRAGGVRSSYLAGFHSYPMMREIKWRNGG